MKKYILPALVAVSAATMFTACDDMLDTDPRVTDATFATFPGKVADVEAQIAATYSIMNTMGGGDADTQNIFYWWEIMSDNCYGSGGLQDNKVKSLHYLVQMNVNQYEQPFVLLYGGINRANSILETIDNLDWTGKEARRNQLLGEAYFMRGLYTLWLTQLYGNVPLVTASKPTPEMEEEADAETQIYPQILSDFVSGKNLMSAERKSGHANTYVAEAFMARAYMFWAGFYKKVADLSTGAGPAIDLVAQEGCEVASLSQSDVVAALQDVYGKYKLLPDFRSLWQYSNSYVWKETHDAALASLSVEDQKDLHNWATYGNGDGHAYDFIADMDPDHCFDMPGMGNGNDEELFQIQFMNASKWGIDGKVENGGIYSTARMYCNYLSVFWALRVNGDNGKRDHTYPFTQGWGQGTPSSNIWNDWERAEYNGGDSYTDIRKLGSLIDCDNELAGYSYVKDDCEESGLGVKKWCGVTDDVMTGDTPWWQHAGLDVSENYKGTLENPMQGEHYEDFYLMRYADVLLMLSELTGDVQYMNEVQKRAGVPLTTSYTLKAMQDERRWEFAFEGLRFNDMRRWSGKDGGEGCYAAKALQAQDGNKITCYGKKNGYTMKHMTNGWNKRYDETDGFLMKPENQITLMNGKLKQNKGWDPADPNTLYQQLW